MVSRCVNPPLPGGCTADDRPQTKPANAFLPLLLAALAMGIAMELFGPSAVRGLFEAIPLENIGGLSALFAALVAAMALHEAGHLMAALLLDFEVLGGSLGPCRVSRLHGRWTVQFSLRAPLCGSISAIPRDTEAWRTRMLMVIVAGPAATLVSAIAAFSLLAAVSTQGWGAAFLAALTQFNFFIFVLGLIPNGPKARARNDANLFSALRRNTPDAQEILLYHLVAQMEIAGLRPRDYPRQVIRKIAMAQGRMEARLLYANTVMLWAMDRGDAETADAWDRRAVELSDWCDLRLQNLTLARSACFDVIFRKDFAAARSKFADVEFATLTPEWFRHRVEAAHSVASGNISGALEQMCRAQFLFPKRLPYYDFEKMLLQRLYRLALEVRQASGVL